MKTVIKYLLPEPIKRNLRKIENLFLRARYGFTKPLVLTDIYGIRFMLYPGQNAPIRWLIERSAYQKELVAIKKIVGSGQTAFDIGANIGTLSTILAQAVSENGRVLAFEPFPETFRRLKETLALNDFHNIRCIEAAVSEKSGTMDFYYEPSNPELNSLGQVSTGEKKIERKISVAAVTVDGICASEKISRIDFLKIDVEGFELDVIRGSADMLRRKQIDVIQFEVSQIPLQSLGRTSADIIHALNDAGYSVFEFNEGSQRFTGPIDVIKESYDNYYASHRDLTSIK
jgi:FkbM family methyltransferase